MYIDNDGAIIYYKEVLTHISYNQVSFLISKLYLSKFKEIKINKIIFKDKTWKSFNNPCFIIYENVFHRPNYFELSIYNGNYNEIDESIIRDIKISLLCQ